MAIRIVRLGTARVKAEGVRVGTVRRPPRGVRRDDYAKLDYYDVWLPQVAPSAELVGWIRERAEDPSSWKTFEKRYRAEMAAPDTRRLLELLVAMGRQTDFSIGCYCEEETRCHRSILGKVLAELGAPVLRGAAPAEGTG
jgi:uncharacterized protein YeaO (DUF488 family)